MTKRHVVGLQLLALAATAALAATLPPLPGEPDPAALHAWWAASGEAAPMTVVHAVALVLAAWLAAVTALHLAMLVRPTGAVRVAYRTVTTAAVRRALGGTAAVALSLPSAAAALAPTPPTPPGPPIVIVAVDEADEPVVDITLHDVGPAAADVAPPATSKPTEATWRVEPGDHLWGIAEQTLRDRGREADDGAVDRYWRRVVAANQHVVGDDPDLIHPGDTIVLPD